MTKVSIILPFFENKKWLLEAIESVSNQAFKDYEIILINDGSNENIIKYIKNISNIIYLRQENKGPSSARNLGIKISHGEYIAFLDSDDLFLPDKLEFQISLMDSFKDAILIHSSYLRINGEGREIEVINSGKFSGKVYPQIIHNCPIATPTVMVRKNSIVPIKFDNNIRFGEDIILWSKIAKNSEIIGIDKVLAKVRIHNNAINNPSKYLEGNLNILKALKDYDDELSAFFLKYCLSSIYLSVSKLYFKNKKNKDSFKFYFLSFIKWPFNLNIYKKIILLIIPSYLRKWIKRKKIKN